MANGLDSGDSIKGSDKFKFFRGERASLSPGERDVEIDKLVEYLNDPAVLTAVGGGLSTVTASDIDPEAATDGWVLTSDGTAAAWEASSSGASADELARIELLEKNLGVNSLRDAIAEGWSVYDMVDGFTDVFTDETGVNTGAGTNVTYNAANDYYTTPVPTGINLLIQSNTTNGSTAFTDTIGTHTITSNGDAQHSTALGATGDAYGGSTSVIRFDGTGDDLTIADSADWAFGAGDFTVGSWVRLDAITGTQTIIAQWAGTTNNSWELATVGDELQFRYRDDATNQVTIVSTTSPLSATTWHWCTAVRSGNTITLYVDGSSVATGDVTGVTLNDSAGSVTVGTTQATQRLTGYLDDIIVRTDVFTSVPTAAISVGGDTTIIGASQTASSAPTNARMVILHDPVATVTLNTDCVLSISRDGGTTYTAFTLTKEADYGTVDGGTVEILTTDDLDISAQPSGTSMVYKFATANSKEQRLHGVYAQWR